MTTLKIRHLSDVNVARMCYAGNIDNPFFFALF